MEVKHSPIFINSTVNQTAITFQKQLDVFLDPG